MHNTEQRSRSPLPALRPPRVPKQGPSLDIPIDPALGNPPKQSPVISSNNDPYYSAGPHRGYHHSFSLYDQQQSPVHIQPQPPYMSQSMGQHPMQQQQQSPQQPQPQHQHPQLMPHPGPQQAYGQQQYSGPSQNPFQIVPNPPQALAPASTSSRGGRGRNREREDPNAGKLRKLEPAPIPPHRAWSVNNGPELRTVAYDYKESIKDYSAAESLPLSGPTFIRGWNNLNAQKRPRGMGHSSGSGRNQQQRQHDAGDKEREDPN